MKKILIIIPAFLLLIVLGCKKELSCENCTDNTSTIFCSYEITAKGFVLNQADTVRLFQVRTKSNTTYNVFVDLPDFLKYKIGEYYPLQ